MSTELFQSAFYDVGDLLYKQQRKNLLKNQMNERRATVTAATMSTTVVKPRTMSTNSFIPIGGQAPSSVSPPGSESCLLNNQESLHRKLDRSMSEPGATLNSTTARQQTQNVNSSRYKTELCRPFEESGHCKYGDKCQFAHGAHELRNLNRHPKYKTELCRTFHTIGFCPYGPRCHFIHNDEERNQNVNQNRPPNHPAMMTASTTVQQQNFPSHMDHLSQVKRPTSFSSSCNGSLGSSSESLSSSASDSPSLSPIFWGNDDIFRDFSSSSQYSSSGSSSPVFDYSADPASSLAASLLTPLNVQTAATTANQNLASEINILQQQINVIMNLSNQCNDNHSVFDSATSWDLAPPAPHSPPDSISGDSLGSASSGSCGSINTCGSPLDVSKSLRLPIFNKLSQDD
ncbi:mRNA decay activator protein ZFP36L2-A-like isoform X1 [Saccostrea cucullata]|uniref:mRNA decay activator protein ZFP36L2-A-like isoform X1 n=1 Tax=Saccostrea cuccullata TaxID=36930 RepID=UPI002ED445D2